MRTGAAWQDVPFLLASVATGTTTLGLRATGQQWERNQRIILDGVSFPDGRSPFTRG